MQTETVDKKILPMTPGYERFLLAWFRLNPKKIPPTEDEYFDFVENCDIKHEVWSPSPSELLEIFPEAVDTIKTLNRGYQDDLNNLDLRFKPILDNIRDKYSGILQETHIQLQEYIYGEEETKLKDNIKRTSHLLRVDEWKRKPVVKGEITDAEIAVAKEVSTKDISGLRFSRQGFAQCPYHNEKTASFKVYPDNRFHCFGCGADGDVIDFVMKQQNIPFLDAVKFLIKS